MVQLSHPYMTTGKTIALTIQTFVGKVISLLFNTLSRFVIAFLPRSKCLLTSGLYSSSTVILEPKKIKSVTVSTFPPSFCHEVMGPDAMILVFWMLSFKPGFSLSSFTFIKRLFSFSFLSANRVLSSAHLRLLIFVLAILIPACASSSLACHIMCPVYKLWRRQWHPTPVLLPGKSHEWRSLVGCSPWGCGKSDTTERLHFHFSLSCIGEGNGNPLQCSCLENPRDGGASWAAVYGVAQSRTWLKQQQ